MLRKFEEYALENPEGSARLRCEYVKATGLSIYVRRSIRYPGVIVLATIKATPERKGHLTRFLEQWSPQLPLEVEHPHNPHLRAFLERLNWRVDARGDDIYVHNDLAKVIVDARGI